MARLMKNGMDTTRVLILKTTEKKENVYVVGLNMKTGHVLPELRSKSDKKRLKLGDIDYMFVYSDVLYCNEHGKYSPNDSAMQRIENILDGFDLVEKIYDKEKDNLYDTQIYKYATVFCAMTEAMQTIFEEEIKPKTKDAFQIHLDNIETEFEEFQKELYENETKKDGKAREEIIRRNTDSIKDSMHKLNLVWNLTTKSDLETYDKLAEEGLDSSKLLNTEPKKRKEEKKPKVEQKTLLEF